MFSRLRQNLFFSRLGLGIGIGAGIGGALFLRQRQKQKLEERQELTFLGQYSIVWQALALYRAGVLTPPVKLYVAKHFTQKTHKDLINAQWGQKPSGTPMPMEDLILSVAPTVSKNEYIPIDAVVKSTRAAIDELREGGIIVNEVETIDNLKVENKKLYVNVTIDSEDPRQTIGLTPEMLHEMRKRQKTKNLSITYLQDARKSVVFNTLTKPRKHANADLNDFVDTTALYSISPHQISCLKIVIGIGPSAIWVKEHFSKDGVIFIGSSDSAKKLIEFARNPRNTATIQSIDVHREVIDNGREARGVINASVLLKLDNSTPRNIRIKEGIKKFMEEHPFLSAREIAVILDENRENIRHIGQGINAIGYEPNLDILQGLTPEFLEKRVFNLQVQPAEPSLTVAPQNIFGSVLHSMDWQLVSKLSQFFGLSTQQQMLFMPIDRLFFRPDQHSKIISDYMKEVAGIEIKPEFFQALKEVIKLQKEGPINLATAEKMVVDVFSKVHQDEGVTTKFQEALHELMLQKEDVFFRKKKEAPKIVGPSG